MYRSVLVWGMAVSLFLLGCDPGKPADAQEEKGSSEKTQLMWVRFHYPGCEEGNRCLEAQYGEKLDSTSWEDLHKTIEGFEYEAGHIYRIKVVGESGKEMSKLTLLEVLVDSATHHAEIPLDIPSGKFRYRAQGNEPFWSLSIEEDALIVFDRLGEKQVRLNFEEYAMEGDHLVWRVQWLDAPQEIVIMVSPGTCTDDMSGDEFPSTCTVMLGERVYKGCGRFYSESEEFKPISPTNTKEGEPMAMEAPPPAMGSSLHGISLP